MPHSTNSSQNTRSRCNGTLTVLDRCSHYFSDGIEPFESCFSNSWNPTIVDRHGTGAVLDTLDALGKCYTGSTQCTECDHFMVSRSQLPADLVDPTLEER